MDKSTKRTPLYNAHIVLGAKMVPFGGFEMPVQYAGVIAEHICVRNAVGLFDISHMGEFVISGPGALDFLQRVTINNVAALQPGQAQYSAMCYSDGGIVDDVVLYHRKDHYMMIVNASNIEKDFNWLRSNIKGAVNLENQSDNMALIAIQGPASRKLLARLNRAAPPDLKFYRGVDYMLDGCPVFLSRTGYTGELGFEIYVNPASSEQLWHDFLDAGEDLGVQPVGLGARDTLRLEMAYRLYGNDIDADINPIEAGLGWITKMDKGWFIGSEAVQKTIETGSERKLAGLKLEQRGIPRHGYPLRVNGESVGIVTSGNQSPVLRCGIALGFLPVASARPGRTVEVEIRGKGVTASVIKPPFISGTSLLN
ncbi:glycine cleavage system aminomethyltransferase GcvT [Candidatus Neomarinimicrobiota bacterium]